MHIIKDENGNICAHEHSHDGETHCHDHAEAGHCHHHGEGHCHGEECGQNDNGTPADKNAALLQYMLDHNTHHAAELDQMAAKLASDGHDKAAEQIRKAVDEFQKGNMYLGLAISLVKE